MQSQTALVWTKRRIELHAIASIYLQFTLVIFPRDTELDHSFWDCGNFEGGLVFGVFFKQGGVF